jgi:hypothetical protein
MVGGRDADWQTVYCTAAVRSDMLKRPHTDNEAFIGRGISINVDTMQLLARHLDGSSLHKQL